jgi:hypothetical protein
MHPSINANMQVGWSHEAQRWRGTYNASWTWFEAGVKKANGTVLPHRPIQINIHADQEFHTHVNVWDYQCKDPGLREWLSKIEGGDTIQVFPKARFNGWVNYVGAVEIHLWSDSVIPDRLVGLNGVELVRRSTMADPHHGGLLRCQTYA